MENDTPPFDRFDVGVLLLLVASALLVVGFFLPWYTSTSQLCGHTQTVSQSAFAAGGWRFDLLVLTAATAVTSLLGRSRRLLTFVLALPLPFLALFWASNYELTGPTVSCPSHSRQPSSLRSPRSAPGPGPCSGSWPPSPFWPGPPSI
jgi:hypothetical protein